MRTTKPDHRGLEAFIYERLRDDICRLQRPPGSRLLFQDLASEFGVSFTPVRNALARLATDGFVTSIPRHGSYVASLTMDELEEILSVRLGVEPVIAKLGAERCTDGALREMEALLPAIDDAFRENDVIGCFQYRSRLRDICYRCADRPRLFELVVQQRLRYERYIRFLPAGLTEAVVGTQEHHVLLLDACRAQDGRQAAASTRAALDTALTEISERLNAIEREAGVAAPPGLVPDGPFHPQVGISNPRTARTGF